MTIKVGTTLWFKQGYSSREDNWEKGVIDGETTLSWLINSKGWNQIKINKKTMLQASKNGFGGGRWYTAEGKSDKEWQEKHRGNISRAVDGMDVHTLRKIAELIGYKP